MAYSDFTLERLEHDFQLTIDEQQGLFADLPPVPVEDFLARFLEEFVPLGLAINTEKARSEYIIAPILGELRLGSDLRLPQHWGSGGAVGGRSGVANTSL